MEYLPGIGDALLVNLSLAFAYILLPLLLFRWGRPNWRADFKQIGIAGLAAIAMATQAVVGPVASIILSPTLHRFEALVYLVSVAVIFRMWPTDTQPATVNDSEPLPHSLLLPATIIIGLALRLVAPVQDAALGQSDAYSHLSFISSIIANGTMDGAIYPPGYHWVAALPALVIPLDPYCIARYGGAFFGIILVFAIKELAELSRKPFMGLTAAFLIACFPGSVLLMKTSVGAYANQLGLLFLPVIIRHYILMTKGVPHQIPPLMALAAGLMASVPMMACNILLLFGADTLFRFFKNHLRIVRHQFILATSILLTLLTAGGYFISLHPDFFLASVGIIAGTDRPTTLANGFLVLIKDFVEIKRVGLGGSFLNSALLFVFFLIGLGIHLSFRNRDRAMGFICVWASLSLFQTAFGVFQFSTYQRAGWELNITLTLLGAYILTSFLQSTKALSWLRYGTVVLLLFTVLASFRYYPRHTPVLSASENELITVVRHLSRQAQHEEHLFIGFEKPFITELANLSTNTPVTLIVRQFSDFTHGDPITPLLKNQNMVHYIPIGPESSLPTLNTVSRALVLIDACFTEQQSPPNPLGLTLQPQQFSEFLVARQYFCQVNLTLRAWLEELSATGEWVITPLLLGTLDSMLLERKEIR